MDASCCPEDRNWRWSWNRVDTTGCAKAQKAPPASGQDCHVPQAPTRYDRYLADFEARSAELAGQPSWLRELRQRAISHFREVGLPTARKGNEPWKYTNVAPIANADFDYGVAP